MRAEASQGSTAFWALSQNSGFVRKAAASLSAISAVTEVAVHDSIDHLDVAADVTGNLLLRHSKRQQELLMEDLSWPSGWSSLSHWFHEGGSVIGADVHIGGTGAGPAKDDPPLVVDADAVEPREVALQRLQ